MKQDEEWGLVIFKFKIIAHEIYSLYNFEGPIGNEC